MARADSRRAPRWRCLAVWTASTAAATAVGALGIQAALDAATASPGTMPFEQALVGLAGLCAALACAWLWVLTTWGVADALRGTVVPREAGRWRRLTMVACGCAVSLSVALPAHADTARAPERPDVASLSLLHGLPYPDRAAAGAPPPAAPVSGPVAATTSPQSTHLVRPGDTLWSLATSALAESDAPDGDVAAAVAHLHRTNRAVIGADPDLIVPGQRLDLSLDDTTHREDPR
ncbi:LysM peptidoglycan-binding domain-containing protein [Nocardioides sp. Y6]|uniref:LysM peptidoglycan-binding domain-containing protein n=1 Tax=Nocardioides malaquae TaxID=2773426 RepID=A0ABR9RPH2_9ACTN|nr:LysM domain-containing protein [Nocardioides malaquae]MBE7323472.1 LysM peptidoglycan-binding domain-containing protein [Nocardioides malaquae]